MTTQTIVERLDETPHFIMPTSRRSFSYVHSISFIPGGKYHWKFSRKHPQLTLEDDIKEIYLGEISLSVETHRGIHVLPSVIEMCRDLAVASMTNFFAIRCYGDKVVEYIGSHNGMSHYRATPRIFRIPINN